MSIRPFVLAGLCLATHAAAQLTALAPTASTSIDVDPGFGVLAYSSITIPAGVTVRFTGSYPVRISVTGDVRIDGVVTVAGVTTFPVTSAPGATTLGTGWQGFYQWSPGYYDWSTWPPVWVPGHYVGTPATNGRHATLYGAALPFDLAGGSPGGSTLYMSYSGTYEQQSGGFYPGGGGGGTLVLEADGRIDVNGTVTADGLNFHTTGSGGSILLRGHRGIAVPTGGLVTAVPEGIVRLDAYDQLPQVAGTVQPTPSLVRHPDLRETLPPTLGGTWQLRVIAPRGDAVFLAASFQPGSGTNQYGTYGIDLGNAITFAVVTMPATGHDPLATFQLPVPNVPQLAGLAMWVQGLDWFTQQPPRYTQTLATWIR